MSRPNITAIVTNVVRFSGLCDDTGEVQSTSTKLLEELNAYFDDDELDAIDDYAMKLSHETLEQFCKLDHPSQQMDILQYVHTERENEEASLVMLIDHVYNRI